MTQGRWMMVVAAGVFATAACDNKGSLGNYTDGVSSDAGNDTGDDGNDDGVTSTSGDDNGVSDGVNDDGSDDGGVSDGVMLDVGPGGECEQGCAIECTAEQCAPLGRHHPDGCLKRACQTDEVCDDGQRCYIAALFGGCESSGWDCFDEKDGTCICGGSGDCGGGFCVAEEDFPVPMAGPEGPSRVQNGCAPDDGPAKDIYIGLEDMTCGAAFADGPTLRISIYDLDPGEVGTFNIGTDLGSAIGQAWYTDGFGSEYVAYTGTVTILEYADFVAGSYELFVGDFGPEGALHIAGEFDLAEDCGGDPGCG